MGDMLTQSEIDALLGAQNPESNNVQTLTDSDMEILEQIGQESMELMANTLQVLLNKSIFIGGQSVSKTLLSDIKRTFETPHIGTLIEFTAGLVGSNILILSNDDVKAISDLMMGGDGQPENNSLTELDRSAIGEAMNQAVGNVSNLYYRVLGEKVDINTPKIFDLDVGNEQFTSKSPLMSNMGMNKDSEVIVLEYDFKIGDIVNSKIVSILNLEFAIKLKNKYKPRSDMKNQINSEPVIEEKTAEPTPKREYQRQATENHTSSTYVNKKPNNNRDVNIKSVEFQSFDPTEILQQKENIDIIMDVPLEVTVEMGRTSKKIEEILEFSPGTIIELNKLAGDPIDIVVNGKFVAKGEVVVIDENYGIRITDIINKSKRI